MYSDDYDQVISVLKNIFTEKKHCFNGQFTITHGTFGYLRPCGCKLYKK